MIACAVGQRAEWDETRSAWICVQDTTAPDLSLEIEPDGDEVPTIVLYKNGTWKAV